MHPTFKAAVVQASPVFLDARATVEKACGLIQEAAACGARLIAFPEVYVAGYPYWNWMMSPLEGSAWFRRFFLAAINLDGQEVAALREAAAAANAVVVIGINERSPVSLGTVYNTNLVIGANGELLGRHRKIVPTFAEKLTWGSGDGSSLTVHDTAVGRVGTLACGENTNTLARYALLAQGEQVHVANYIAFPFVRSYDMPAAIGLRAGAHSFEGKVFTLVACSAMSEDILDILGTTDALREQLSGAPNAFSGIYGPNGQLICEPLIDVEGIAYADIDFTLSIEPKQFQDIVGHYQRFDIFQLHVDKTSHAPLHRHSSERCLPASSSDQQMPGSPGEPSTFAAGGAPTT